jgi:L-alanine-DL-glutamate epimerase-like enolase superfamily enzyme
VSSRITSLVAIPNRIPLRRPFATARRTSTVAENVLARLRLADGTEGWGEASPAPYVTGEDLVSVQEAIDGAACVLEGTDAGRWLRCHELLKMALPENPTARSAVEFALADACCRCEGRPLWQALGGARRCVVSDLTIPICPPEEAAEEAVRAVRAGFRHLKIKVGCATVEEDEARVRVIAERAPGCRLRVDANQAFTPEGALSFLDRLRAAAAPVQLLEQPVPADDWEGLAHVTRHSTVPIIADESVRTPADALRVAREGAAHGINVKLAKSGLVESLAIVAIGQAADLELMLGCMLESDWGIAAGVHFACGTGAFRYVDLDSHLLIGLAPPYAGFRQRGAVLSVVGSGLQPSLPIQAMTTTAPAPGGVDAVEKAPAPKKG